MLTHWRGCRKVPQLGWKKIIQVSVPFGDRHNKNQWPETETKLFKLKIKLKLLNISTGKATFQAVVYQIHGF